MIHLHIVFAYLSISHWNHSRKWAVTIFTEVLTTIRPNCHHMETINAFILFCDHEGESWVMKDAWLDLGVISVNQGV